jgi:hypothetical protein
VRSFKVGAAQGWSLARRMSSSCGFAWSREGPGAERLRRCNCSGALGNPARGSSSSSFSSSFYFGSCYPWWRFSDARYPLVDFLTFRSHSPSLNEICGWHVLEKIARRSELFP